MNTRENNCHPACVCLAYFAVAIFCLTELGVGIYIMMDSIISMFTENNHSLNTSSNASTTFNYEN